MRKLRATKPNSALQLFDLEPGMYVAVVQLDRGDKGGARLFNHWVCYDAFRRVFYSGDGDPAILSDDDCTHREAANLVLKEGYSVTEACRSLDIGETALRRWIDQLEGERLGVTPKAKAFTDEQRRIQELEAQVRRLEQEKSILKKATALLMSDEMNRTR